MPVCLYVATSSQGKLRDFRTAAEAHSTCLEPLPGLADIEAPEEDGDTFAANATIKAVYYSQFAPGELVLADDSGLEVDALDGGPGVRTRRYAGEDATDEQNNTKLLRALDGLSPDRRGARYVCVLALALPAERGPRGGQPLTVVRGTCRGRIARAPRGSGGFGYDPIFEPSSEPPGGRTLGEWSQEAKNAISHRGAAARRMTPILRRHGF